ncbi:MAG TPA: hypothetical protein VK024_03915 [Actinomycetaceae bacterium]|nr:hypothetical protein [Actinomycetaceae bacterium]
MLLRSAARAALYVLGVAALVLTSGCSVRLATPEPEVPLADEAERLRQSAARTSAELARLAEGVAAADVDEATRRAARAVGEASMQHVAALGGVWEPWPGAGPEATAYPADPTETPSAGRSPDDPTDAPSPGYSPAAPTTAANDLAAALHQGITEARDQAIAASSSAAAELYGAIAVRRLWAGHDLAAALGEPAPAPPAPPDPDELAALFDASLAARVDGARFAFEVVAARSQGDQRQSALERVAELEQLAAQASTDVTAPVYDVQAPVREAPTASSEAASSATAALAAQAELDVLAALVAAIGPAPSAARDGVLAAAERAALAARSWGAEPPPLPGLQAWAEEEPAPVGTD